MMNKEEMNNMSSIITAVHNGVFHADDVICVALLRLYYPNAEVKVVRTRNADDFKNCNFVFPSPSGARPLTL